MKKLFVIVLILGFLPVYTSILNAQNEAIHFAHFNNTETTVFRDLNNRLIMSFSISGVANQADLDIIQSQFNRYGTFESIQFTGTTDPGFYAVYAITKPGIKIKDIRKLFVLCGISTVFVDDQPYPVENFSVQMLNNN